MAKNPDGSTRYNPDGSVYITPVPSHTINRDAHGNALDPNTYYHYQSDPDHGTPIMAKPGGTYVLLGQRPSPPQVNIPHPNDPYIPSGGGSGNPADRSTTTAEFIKDTYDPELGYERYDSPGDNPYISNYTPPQFGYMNDLSTLSPDELDYREGNIRGLDDRQNSIENPGALLNNYIFTIKEKLNKTPKTKIGIIGKDQEVDNYQDRIFTSREGYESERDKESPYDKYDSSKYY